MSQNKIRIGVVGVGFGDIQIQGFKAHPDCEVVAICSRRLRRAHEAAEKHSIPHHFSGLNDMLKLPGLDLVSVVTPPDLHHDMALAALEAGKHVLCEKPFAMNLAEAQEMLTAARRAKKTHMINHEFRFVPARAYLKEMVEQGYLGRPLSLYATILFGARGEFLGRPKVWQSFKAQGGGFLGAMGSHLLDTFRYLFGEVEAVSCSLATMLKEFIDPATGETWFPDADDTFTVSLRFANGAQGTIVASSAARHGGGQRIEAYGNDGTLVLTADEKLMGGKVGERGLAELPIPERLTPKVAAVDRRVLPFYSLAERLVESVRTGKEVGPSFEDGVRCQELLDACRRSAAEGRWVTLPLKG